LPYLFSIFPHVGGKESSKERMNKMREKFKSLQINEETDMDENIELTYNNANNINSNIIINNDILNEETKKNSAASRWNKLKLVVRAVDTKNELEYLPLSPRKKKSKDEEKDSNLTNDKTIGLEDVELDEYWLNNKIPDPFIDIDNSLSNLYKQTTPNFESDFESQAKSYSLLVGKISQDKVNEEKEKIEYSIFEKQRKNIEQMKQKEADIIWREHLARVRVNEMELEARARINVEKEKSSNIWLDKTRELGIEFRKVRETLESGLKKQHAAVVETYGNLLVHEEVLLIFFF